MGGRTRRGLEEGVEMWKGKKRMEDIGWRVEGGGRSDRCRWEERGEESFRKYKDSLRCCLRIQPFADIGNSRGEKNSTEVFR